MEITDLCWQGPLPLISHCCDVLTFGRSSFQMNPTANELN